MVASPISSPRKRSAAMSSPKGRQLGDEMWYRCVGSPHRSAPHCCTQPPRTTNRRDRSRVRALLTVSLSQCDARCRPSPDDNVGSINFSSYLSFTPPVAPEADTRASSSSCEAFDREFCDNLEERGDQYRIHMCVANFVCLT